MMVLHMSASMVHVHRQNSVAPHVCFCCTRTSTSHLEHIRHSSRVSSKCTSNIVAHVEFLSFVATQLPENVSRVTLRHDLLRYKRICNPVVRNREFVISFDFGSSTSTTRTTGDRLTLLYLHLSIFLPYTLLHNYQSYDAYKDGGGADCCPF